MAFLFGGFSKTKLAEALVGAPARIQLRHSKKKNEISRNKKQVATYLKDKQFDRARIYVESLIGDERKVEAEEIICLMCELLRSRVDYLNGEKKCPPEALESVHTIIFSARFTDIEELKAAAQQFKYKYGDEFFENALTDKAPHSRVNEKIKNRLKISPASAELIAETLTEIAKANNIPFDPIKDLASSEIGLARVPEAAGNAAAGSDGGGGAAGGGDAGGGVPSGGAVDGGTAAGPGNEQGTTAMSAMLPAGHAQAGSQQPGMLFYDPMTNIAYVNPGQMPPGSAGGAGGAVHGGHGGGQQGQGHGGSQGMMMMEMPGGHAGHWAAQGMVQQQPGGSHVLPGIPAGYTGYMPTPGSVPVAVPVGMPSYAHMQPATQGMGMPMLMPSYAAASGPGYPPHLPSAISDGSSASSSAAVGPGQGGQAQRQGLPVLPGGYSYGGMAAGLQDYPPAGSGGGSGSGGHAGAAGGAGAGMDAEGYPIKPIKPQAQGQERGAAAQGRGGGGPPAASDGSDPSAAYEDHVDREKARLRLLEEQAQSRLVSDMAGLQVAGGPAEGAAASGKTVHKSWPGEQGQDPPGSDPSQTSTSAAASRDSFAARLAALKKA